MKKLYLIWTLLGLLFVPFAWAQNYINGTINDETGTPLPGATVIVEGTNRGAASDFDGNFFIEAELNDVLIITYIGYAEQKITVGTQDSYTIVLSPDNELEEVVVTSLGIKREAKALGYAVQKVSSDEIANSGSNNAIDALVGKAAGVQITRSSGSAGGRFDDGSFEGTVNGGGNGGNGVTPIMLAAWTDFMIAETHLLEGDQAAAKASLEAGMTKSIEKTASFIAHDDEPTVTAIENHRNAILMSFDDATSEQERWNVVFEQYWIALYGNGIDAYNAYRRTGYPTSLQPNIEPNPGGFVRSMPYPANFVETNSNVSQKPNVGVKVFWDNNPDSPSFPIAN